VHARKWRHTSSAGVNHENLPKKQDHNPNGEKRGEPGECRYRPIKEQNRLKKEGAEKTNRGGVHFLNTHFVGGKKQGLLRLGGALLGGGGGGGGCNGKKKAPRGKLKKFTYGLLLTTP